MIGFGVVVPRGESVRVSSPVTEASIQARRFGKSRRGKRMDVITMIAFHLARAASQIAGIVHDRMRSLVLWLKDTGADKKESIVRLLACSDQQPRRIRCGQ